MIRRYLAIAILTLSVFIVVPANVSAVDVFQRDVCDEAAAKDATVCKDKNIKLDCNADKNKETDVCKNIAADDPARGVQNPLFGKEGVITKIIGILSVVVAIVSVIIIMLAGLKFITSGTNSQDVSNARERIIYACVGLIVAGLAQAMVRFILDKI